MADNTEITVSEKADNTFSIPKGHICTLDANSDEGKKRIAYAVNGSKPLKDQMNKVLHLKGVLTTPGTRAVSGNDCTNNYLVIQNDDGTEDVLFSQSDGVTRSLKVIVALWMTQLLAGETVDIKCISQNLNNGNTLKTIVPA